MAIEIKTFEKDDVGISYIHPDEIRVVDFRAKQRFERFKIGLVGRVQGSGRLSRKQITDRVKIHLKRKGVRF